VFETDQPLVFVPGQFISIRVNERDIRSYSLAGQVGTKSYGMIVDIKPGGPGSKFFERMQAGQEFNFLGPLGQFVFKPDDGSAEILFLATGTGIAPLKAMLETVLTDGDNRPMTLYFGLRHREDIFWDGYFNSLQTKYANFKFVLCLSKPCPEWRGVCGHITDLLAGDHANLNQASAYLCGNGQMIEEAQAVLQQLAMPKERIYFEKFF
jgi:ferredoxin-NADP reductase